MIEKHLHKGTDSPKLDYNDLLSLPTLFTSGAKVKIGLRELGPGSGDVEITGLGFQPKCIIILAQETGGGRSIGFGTGPGSSYEVSMSIAFDAILGYIGTTRDASDDSDWWQIELKSIDSDGFTLTFTKHGTPAADCLYKCLAIK